MGVMIDQWGGHRSPHSYMQKMMRIPRHILVFFALVLAGVVALSGLAWQRSLPRAYAPQGPGDIYLALGDSLAWGFALDRRDAESYPALIRAALGAGREIALVNSAFPGETSASFLRSQLPRALRVIREARAEGRLVSPITIDIGGNDLRNAERGGQAERAAAVEAVGRNLAQILDELRAAAGPQADIAVMTYYNPYGGDPASTGSEAYWVVRLNATIGAVAAPRGVAVADVYPAFDGGRAYTHTLILFGDIHANAQGHRLIAEVFLTALRYREE